MHRSVISMIAFVVALPIAATAVAQTGRPAAAKSWTCTAPGLVNASYDGGASAYVHLVGFSSGGTYAVTLNKAGTVATGTTANGTKFTCTAS